MGTSTRQYPVKYVSPDALSSALILLQLWCITVLRSFLSLSLSLLGDLLPVMCDRAGFIQDTSLILYEVWIVYFSIISILLADRRGIFFCLFDYPYICDG